MTGRILSRADHRVQLYPGKIDWTRVLGFGLAAAVVAITIIGRTAR